MKVSAAREVLIAEEAERLIDQSATAQEAIERVEQRGIVFLDEIESMPLALQVKLLRVLQERRLERLGGNSLIALDCRLIAASKSDLLSLSTEGKFREDLYYRLAVVACNYLA